MKAPKSPFLASVHDYMLTRHYAKRTIETYLYWIYRYILFHQKTQPAQLNCKNTGHKIDLSKINSVDQREIELKRILEFLNTCSI